MKISYKKLWIKLVEMEMSKSEFRNKLEISPGTLTKLNKNEPVSLEILMRICKVFRCDIGDICEVILDE